MNELISVIDAGYVRYEQLLLKKDQYQKEADIYYAMYLREFGDQIQARFSHKVECIRLRKAITLYQAALNSGVKINQAELQHRLSVEMKRYYEELSQIAQHNEAAKNMTYVSTYTAQLVKKLYRQIAKQLHPDLNPKTAESAVLQDLWNRVAAAYRANDLAELEALQVLVNHQLSEMGNASAPVIIANIDQRITELEKEIKKILENDPYQYRYLLEDDEAVQTRHEEYASEISELMQAAKELQTLLDNVMSKGGYQWLMN